MKVKCKNCLPKEGIDVPEFTKNEKKQFSTLKLESPIKGTKHLINHYKLSHRDAKYIIMHINEKYGKCNRCNFNELNKEYINCPKCKALNFNWKIY